MVGEFLLTFLILVVAIFLLVMSTKFPVLRAYDKLGPAFWPRIVLVGLIILNGMWLAKLILTQGQDLKANLSKIALGNSQERNILRLLLVIAICLMYTFLIPILGFLLLTPIFQLLVLLAMGTRKWTTLTITPLLLTAVLFGIFISILHIPLPRGIGVFNVLSRMLY